MKALLIAFLGTLSSSIMTQTFSFPVQFVLFSWSSVLSELLHSAWLLLCWHFCGCSYNLLVLSCALFKKQIVGLLRFLQLWQCCKAEMLGRGMFLCPSVPMLQQSEPEGKNSTELPGVDVGWAPSPLHTFCAGGCLWFGVWGRLCLWVVLTYKRTWSRVLQNRSGRCRRCQAAQGPVGPVPGSAGGLSAVLGISSLSFSSMCCCGSLRAF